jgi:hypothetical protein
LKEEASYEKSVRVITEAINFIGILDKSSNLLKSLKFLASIGNKTAINLLGKIKKIK